MIMQIISVRFMIVYFDYNNETISMQGIDQGQFFLELDGIQSFEFKRVW